MTTTQAAVFVLVVVAAAIGVGIAAAAAVNAGAISALVGLLAALATIPAALTLVSFVWLRDEPAYLIPIGVFGAATVLLAAAAWVVSAL